MNRVPGEDRLTVVMYHYVRPTDPRHAGLRALHVDDFVAQLDHLGAQGPPVDASRVVAAAAADEPLPSGWSLTFDDGLRDHVEVVLPELVRRGWTASFFVPAGPFLTGRALDVHLVHGLLARHGGTATLAALHRALDELGVERPSPGLGSAAYRRHDDDADALAVRRTLNYDLAPDLRSPVLDRLDADLGSGVTVADWYLDGDDLRELRDQGMVLGAHSVSHRPLAQLADADQADEVEGALRWLESVVGPAPRTWCHPYGGPGSFDDRTLAALSAAGVVLGVAAGGGPVTPRSWRDDRLALPRVDCCELPHGRSRAAAGRPDGRGDRSGRR